MDPSARKFTPPNPGDPAAIVAHVDNLGIVTGVNPLREKLPEAPPKGRLIAYSGWGGEQPGLESGVWAASFETWGPEGRAALGSVCDTVCGGFERAGATLCFRPHARHVLGDPQTCLSFLRAHEGGPFEALLEPAAFLTPGMIDAAEDHVERAIGALGDRRDVPAVLVSDVEIVETGSERELRLVPPGEGVLPEGLVARLAGACGKPTYVLGR